MTSAGVPCEYRPDQGRLAGNAAGRKAVHEIRYGPPVALEKAADPRGIASAPAAFGADTEGRDHCSRGVDASTVSRLVTVVEETEIEPSRRRYGEADQRREVAGIVAILRHGQVKEVDGSGDAGEDRGRDLGENGRVL